MPAAHETFQQMTGPAEGPFSDYLRPVQPRPIDQPSAPPTGYESGPVAAGTVALDFLKGVRQNRLAQFHEQDANVQRQMDNYRALVAEQSQNPDLTEEGRAALAKLGHDTIVQHGNYELRDVKPEHGAAHVFKSIFQGLTGGPIKTREPVDFEKESGRVMSLAQQHSQKANFGTSVAEAQQAMEQLKRENPNPSQEQVMRALQPTYLKVLQAAPNYANAFVQSMGMGYMPAGSVEYQMSQLDRSRPGGSPQAAAAPSALPQTAPPPPSPGSMEFMTQGMGPSAVPPTAPPPGVAPPAAAPAAGVPGEVQYDPNYGPQRFAALTSVAGLRNSPVQVGQPHLVAAGSRRLMGVQVMGSRNPDDNGYWDAQTGQKIVGPVSAVSVAGTHVVRKGADNMAMYWDANQGREVYDLGPDGKPYKIPENYVSVTLPNGDVVWQPKSQAEGKTVGGVGLINKRTAAEIRMLPVRDQYKIGDERRQQLMRANTSFEQKNLTTNQTYDNWINQIRAKNIDIALQGLSSIGVQVSPDTARAAMNNPQPLIDIIEQQRRTQLDRIRQAYSNEKQGIDDYYPELNLPKPATAPPPGRGGTAAPRTAAPPAAPAKKKVVGLGDIPE